MCDILCLMLDRVRGLHLRLGHGDGHHAGNTSRACAKLGIEYILVSADIEKKRENVRRNVEAGMRRPDLGTVLLFTAGDKPFYYYANKLKRQLGVEAIIFCQNGRLEKSGSRPDFAASMRA